MNRFVKCPPFSIFYLFHLYSRAMQVKTASHLLLKILILFCPHLSQLQLSLHLHLSRQFLKISCGVAFNNPTIYSGFKKGGCNLRKLVINLS